jgi:hypothetical protein
MKQAYGDLFVLKANPTPADRSLIEGKFKSAHNTSPHVAKLQASTFYALLALADMPTAEHQKAATTQRKEASEAGDEQQRSKTDSEPTRQGTHRPSLHYNIQIHLPATKDIEVFNAIFKSLKEHLLE